MASTSNEPPTPEVKLPKDWVPCPLCGKHLVFKGREAKRLCRMILDP